MKYVETIVQVAAITIGLMVGEWLFDVIHSREVAVTYYRDGKITKSGEPFNPYAYTCAVDSENKMGRWYEVSFEGKKVYVFANDLTPNKGNVDLSMAAFARLAPLSRGVFQGEIKPAK